MELLASNLMAHARGVSTAMDDNAPESNVRNLDTSPLRVGLWPLVSDDAPETALGLMAVLGLLLERWPAMLVYRLFVRAGGDPDDYRWQLADSQFDVDDWQLDYLDENVAVWGTLASSGGWTLTLKIENDLAETEEIPTLTYISPDLAGLVERLPAIAADIAGLLDAGAISPVAATYDMTGVQKDVLPAALRQAFLWERDLFLLLWDADPDEFDAQASAEGLRRAAEAAGGDFGGWLYTRLARRALLPAVPPVYEEAFAGQWAAVPEWFANSASAALAAAQARFDAGEEADALRQLQRTIARFPERVELRLGLAELHRRAGNAQEMVDALQEAIGESVADAALYFVYGSLLASLRQSGLVVSRFILIEARDRQPERMTEEAAAAFEAGLALEPERADMLQRYLLLLIERGDARLWPAFERLLALDDTGEQVRAVVESFVLLEDFDEGIALLEAAVAANPERADLRVNLASALLYADDTDAAAVQLEAAHELTDDEHLLAEIERLSLVADDPEFEMRLGELTELVDAGRALSSRDIEYLEAAIESAPSFLAVHLLIARAFVNQGQTARALEALLDAQTELPDEPEILELLARVLWESGETDLAFDYLNKGLAAHPEDVPLLALTGRYLFEQGQDEEARALLSRAQSLNPRNRALREVQRLIAQQLGRSLLD